MSAIFGSLFTAFWPYIIAGIAGLTTLVGFYFKGRSDAKAKAQNADLKSANQILKEAADARDRAADIRPVSGVMPNDGWRRD